MIGALVTGGISLLGGLFGRSDKKKQERAAAAAQAKAEKANAIAIQDANRVNAGLADVLNQTPLVERRSTSTRRSLDVAGMMAAAEASGFNPVTFLQGGGMQAFISEEVYEDGISTGHNAVAAAQLASPQVQQVAPKPTSTAPGLGSVFTNALSAGFGAYQDQKAREDSQNFQKELLNMQLNGIQKANGTGGSRSFYVPSKTTSGSQVTSAGSAGLGSVSKPKPGDTTLTNPHPRPIDPTIIDTDAYSALYGEPGEYVFGPLNMMHNGIYWLTGTTAEQRANATAKVYDTVKENVLKPALAKYIDVIDRMVDNSPAMQALMYGNTAKPATPGGEPLRVDVRKANGVSGAW